MKHCFTILVLFAASPVFGQSGNTKLLTGESCKYFIRYDSMFLSGDSATYAYDNEKRLYEQRTWSFQNNIWEQINRIVELTYDANGNKHSQVLQTTEDGVNWANSLRSTFTYDALGHKLSEVVEQWENGSWVSYFTNIWSYDGNGKLLSEGNEFYRVLYSFNLQGDLETALTQSFFSNGIWYNVTLITYSYSVLSGGKPAEVWTQYDFNNAWVNAKKIYYSYDGNGDVSGERHEGWDYGIGWSNDFRVSWTYDNNHHPLTFFQEKFNGSNWINDSKGIYKYDAELNLLSIEADIWFFNAWEKYFTCRYYYTEFVTTHTPALTNFQAFPNPASTTLTLQGENLTQAKIFDQQGRQVRAQILHGQAEETIQLGNLLTGNYLLQAIGADGKVGAKSLQIRH